MHLLKDFVIPFCFNSKLHFIESTEGATFTLQNVYTIHTYIQQHIHTYVQPLGINSPQFNFLSLYVSL